MSWPSSQDFNEAIQAPRVNFTDPDLRGGLPVLNVQGIPIPRSGNVADVYEFRCPGGGCWAVKCFTREVAGLRERYEAISRHLSRVKSPFFVDFTFLQQGIRVGSEWFPVVKMRWVEGLTLNAFGRQYADKPQMLNNLLRTWVRMAARIRQAGIAHADLQHGNVLLASGPASNTLLLQLVDYDGMFVPALAGSDSGETGHRCYQHPKRLTEGTYNREVDRFPLLLIATALSCLKVGGRALWDKYDDGDNFLFHEEDLLAPATSPLFGELQSLTDPQASRLVKVLQSALKGRLESAPLLEEVLPELYSPPAAKPATPLSSTGVAEWLKESQAAPARKAPPRVRKSTPIHEAVTDQPAIASQPAVSTYEESFDPIESYLEDEQARSRRRSNGILAAIILLACVGMAFLVLVIVTAARRNTELAKAKETRPVHPKRDPFKEIQPEIAQRNPDAIPEKGPGKEKEIQEIQLKPVGGNHFPQNPRDPEPPAGAKENGGKGKDVKEDPIENEPKGLQPPRPPDPRENAVLRYEKLCKSAGEALLKGFDDVIDKVAKRPGSEDERANLIKLVGEEKDRFEAHRLIPWSREMRPYIDPYLKSLMKAQDELRSTYHSLATKERLAKKRREANDLEAELSARLGAASVMARWRQFTNGKAPGVIVVLYSDGEINGGIGKWNYDKGKLYYRFDDKELPGGKRIAILDVSDDGTRYSGRNNDYRNNPTLTGEYLK